MHTVAATGSGTDERSVETTSRETGDNTKPVRVAVAGATGYTGQELLRLLARHPAVSIALATSSASNSQPRPLPALAHVWNGAITPLAPDALANDADIVFLALPDI